MTLLVLSAVGLAANASADESIVRIATFNASLNRSAQGQLARDLASGNDRQAKQVAAIIQHVRPDILLINEFDWDSEGKAAQSFQTNYLETGQFGEQPIKYEYSYSAPVNTGEPSGRDLNSDGREDGPEDAYGFGRFPGQYGMLILSRFPIDRNAVRTFQQLRWNDMPGALRPINPQTGQSYYDDATWRHLRLSSKSHWDVPIRIDGDRSLHVLAAHPTPPVFDGAEDRNGRRNHDEIRFWSDYLSADATRQSYLVDDQGKQGGLAPGESFVILGDLNSDPFDGDSRHEAIVALLNDQRVAADVVPESVGGHVASEMQKRENESHQGEPRHDTADFGDRPPSSGNLRVDYVLPSTTFTVRSAGVFWPDPAVQAEMSQWTECSDHRLVWVDLVVKPPAAGH